MVGSAGDDFRDISLTFKRLYTLLRRTKTTGATRRIKELPVCVSEKAFFEDPSWLAEGFELLKQGRLQGDYLLPRIKGDGTLERRDGGFGPPPGDGWATDCGPDLLVGTQREFCQRG